MKDIGENRGAKPHDFPRKHGGSERLPLYLFVSMPG